MISQRQTRARLLSAPRFTPYLTASNQDDDAAWELYSWATELSGAMHAQISFVEIAVRNTLDRELSRWNASQGGPVEWTAEHGAKGDLYGLLGKELREARARARKESKRRPKNHPRHGVTPTHDDVVAQIMLGTWVKVLIPLSQTEPHTRQQNLWAQGISGAFANGNDGSDAARVGIGTRLDSIRRLRNRVAHHDNILDVKVAHRLNEILGVVHKIDPNYPALVMHNSRVRVINRADPRK
ncbi:MULTISPECIES: hypothetical protein [unclassified Microbacterium]|uniref:hypothetical protein n=1 Tax=unclassified Microbacterium TaxID=2609290 RepID=UPI003019E26C